MTVLRSENLLLLLIMVPMLCVYLGESWPEEYTEVLEANEGT